MCAWHPPAAWLWSAPALPPPHRLACLPLCLLPPPHRFACLSLCLLPPPTPLPPHILSLIPPPHTHTQTLTRPHSLFHALASAVGAVYWEGALGERPQRLHPQQGLQKVSGHDGASAPRAAHSCHGALGCYPSGAQGRGIRVQWPGSPRPTTRTRLLLGRGASLCFSLF